jgi:hypothetical protein
MRRARTAFSLILLVLTCGSALAQAAAVEPRLGRVRLRPGITVGDLVNAGIDVVTSKGDEVCFLEHGNDAEQRLARLGLSRQILDEHPGRTLAERTRADIARRPALPSRKVRSAIEPDGVFRTYGLPPVGSGSMAGFWTVAEIKMKLDALVAEDADDVVANKLDTLGTTANGRPVWGLKIGKTIPGPDTRPVVFMNALTHAREPAGMQTLFYFVDHLLAGYGSDPFATYLLDKRVLYIVPLVNPDGYAINESTWFGSGGTTVGYWRKNARDNNGNMVLDSNDGVDINRNFPFQWGGGGSSGNMGDETYRGPSAGSEPETGFQRNIVTTLHPVTGISFHTFSDLMLHPWGYTTTATVDAAAFREWTDELTRDNGYIGGQGPAVLYQVSGEFNDWTYGDTLAKPRMFSWTPEVGGPDDDFWPTPSRIEPLAIENLRACYVITAIAGPYVQEDGVTIAEGAMNAGHLAHITVRARNLGVTGSAGPGLAGTLFALDAGAHVLRASVGYPTLGSRQSGNPVTTHQVAVDDTVTPGRLLRFRIDWTAPGGFFSRDTIVIPAGTPTQIAFDDASSGMTKWTLQGPGTWGITMNDPNHPSRYFADSPAGPYVPDADARMRLLQLLNLSTCVHAYALFESRWEAEPDYDGGYVEASLDGINYTPIRSTGTTPGSGVDITQPAGLPVFAGSRHNWKREMADLSEWTGAGKTAVYFRFRFRSDGGNPSGTAFDGMAVDSFRIVIYDPAAQPAPVAVGDGILPATTELAAPFPNPARGLTRLTFALPAAGNARLEILDVQGRRVRMLADGALAAGRYVRGWDLRDERDRPVPPGVYLARFSGATGSLTRRLVVTR